MGKPKAPVKKSPVKKQPEPEPIIPPPPPVITICQSNKYPGLLAEPQEMKGIKIQCPAFEEVCQSLANGFTDSKRVLIMTPWANYAVFRVFNGEINTYYVHDQCLCVMDVLRYLDLQQGTAGFICFQDPHDVSTYILDDRFKRKQYETLPKTEEIDKVCFNFCCQGGPNLFQVCDRRGKVTSGYDYQIKQCLFPKKISGTCRDPRDCFADPGFILRLNPPCKISGPSSDNNMCKIEKPPLPRITATFERGCQIFDCDELKKEENLSSTKATPCKISCQLEDCSKISPNNQNACGA